MTASNGRCEWECEDYCCIPEYIRKCGFKCPSAIPPKEGEIGDTCGATDADLMSEEEWEEVQK